MCMCTVHGAVLLKTRVNLRDKTSRQLAITSSSVNVCRHTHGHSQLQSHTDTHSSCYTTYKHQ